MTTDNGNTMRVWLPHHDLEGLRELSNITGLSQSLLAQLFTRAGIAAARGRPLALPIKFEIKTGAQDGVKPVPRRLH